METPKKINKREKNRNQLKLHADGQGGGRGLDVGGLVLWGGSLVIAGLVTVFTIRNRRRARDGNSRNHEDCRDGEGLRYAVGKDQNSHHDSKQENSCCVDKGMPDIDVAPINAFVTNYNLIHENPAYEVSGKMDFDREILPPYDPIPEVVTCGNDQSGVVAESSLPAPDFPPLPKGMWGMNKELSPIEQSIDLGGESKGPDLPHDEQMHQCEHPIQLIPEEEDDVSLQAYNAPHYVHMGEGESPIKLIFKEDGSLLETDVCNEETLEEEEPATQSIVVEEEEEKEEDNDVHTEKGELLAQLMSDEGTHQVSKPSHCEHLKEQVSLTPSTDGGRGEACNEPDAKHMEEGEMSTPSTEKDEGEDADSECDDKDNSSNEIEGYNGEYYEKNSEGTPPSSIESNSEPLWPAESMDETSFELKETTGFSQDQHKNLSPMKKEASSRFGCEKDGGEDICNASIDDKHNLKLLPLFLEQVIHEVVAVARGAHTLNAKNWLMFTVALFLFTFTLVCHRFVKSSVLNVDDFPSL